MSEHPKYTPEEIKAEAKLAAERFARNEEKATSILGYLSQSEYKFIYLVAFQEALREIIKAQREEKEDHDRTGE